MRRAGAPAPFTRHDVACVEALAAVLLPEYPDLPGAVSTGTATRFFELAGGWSRAVRARMRWLIVAWEWGPLASRHFRRFSSLSRDDQRRWTQACFGSRAPWRRLLASALKQLVFIAWASVPEVEDALGYDYRCRRDDEVHGARRATPPAVRSDLPAEPGDYLRPGPALSGGAIPMALMERQSFEPRADHGALETRSWPDLEDGRHERADVVVIGSGAGGAVVATTLAEAGADVVVVEEGPHVTAERDFSGPPFERFQRFCRDGATTQALGVPPIPMPMGRVVGGTTVVNSGTCFRAPARVLRRWDAEFGVDSADAIQAHYEDIESFLSVRPVPWELLGPNGMAAHRGAVALGYSGGPLLRNITDCHGCGQCVFGCPTNAKQAMQVSYLPRAVRAGARVYSSCRVERIVTDDGAARGVEVSLLADGSRRGRMRIDAKAVFVCAGAVHTPVLLKASGVPDPSGQTGRNLRIHPATGVGGFFDHDVTNWKGTLQSYYIDEFFDSHELMFEATTTVPGVGAGSLPRIGGRAMAELADFRKLATLGFYVSDTSAGRVTRLPRGAAIATYRLNALDARRIVTGLAVAAEVLLAAGATRVYPGLPGIDAISAREDLVRLREGSFKPSHLRLTAFHPMGTARMGADPQGAVVDPYGRHHSMANLWVADASVFPTCVGVNPQMTIMAFATRSAQDAATRLGG